MLLVSRGNQTDTHTHTHTSVPAMRQEAYPVSRCEQMFPCQPSGGLSARSPWFKSPVLVTIGNALLVTPLFWIVAGVG